MADLAYPDAAEADAGGTSRDFPIDTVAPGIAASTSGITIAIG